MTAAANFGVLNAEEFAGLHELYDEELFHEFPIQRLFGDAEIVDQERIIIDVQEHVRLVGDIKSARGSADPKELFKWTQKIAEHGYQAIKKRIDSQTLKNLRLAGEAHGQLSKRQRAEEVIARDTLAQRRLIERTNEDVAIKMLTNSSYTITLDGVAQAFSTGVNVDDETAVAVWTGTSVNLAARMELRLRQYKQRYGKYPDVVLMPDTFFADVVAGNDDAKELYYRHPELYREDLPLEAAAMVAARTRAGEVQPRYRVLQTDTQYDDGTGTLANLFPDDRLVFVGAGPDDLRRFSVEDEDNGYMGGVASWVAESNEPPRGKTLYTTDATLFMIANEQAVSVVHYK